MAEISAVLERLQSNAHFARGRHRLLPLHSAISPQQQRAAFEVRAARRGRRSLRMPRISLPPNLAPLEPPAPPCKPKPAP
jgi:hypothetical protein